MEMNQEQSAWVEKLRDLIKEMPEGIELNISSLYIHILPENWEYKNEWKDQKEKKELFHKLRLTSIDIMDKAIYSDDD